MEKTANPICVLVRVPWLPAVMETDLKTGETWKTTREVMMPVVAWLEAIDFGVNHGAN